ncbi:hypothetical protein B0T24DRAFT_71235 [Lasiosphaeria ovina]|uniref:Uncharacterized protein n=1 Tax=Lasiosphaeria ovina TaxID=92902 RepID=A0AAE0TYD3_9PEZI|nr:hypothetical protein B0T24DRAFT_71235 [Lasiosphaeria ovina]
MRREIYQADRVLSKVYDKEPGRFLNKGAGCYFASARRQGMGKRRIGQPLCIFLFPRAATEVLYCSKELPMYGICMTLADCQVRPGFGLNHIRCCMASHMRKRSCSARGLRIANVPLCPSDSSMPHRCCWRCREMPCFASQLRLAPPHASGQHLQKLFLSYSQPPRTVTGSDPLTLTMLHGSVPPWAPYTIQSLNVCWPGTWERGEDYRK